MRKLITTAILASIMALALAGAANPARAQTTTYRFDFIGGGSGGLEGWYYDDAFAQEGGTYVEGVNVINYPSRCPGDGWCIYNSGWSHGTTLTAVFSMGADVEISEVTFSFNTLAEGLGRTVSVKIYNSAMSTVFSYSNSVTGPGGQTTQIYTPPSPVTGRYVVIHFHTEWSAMIDWVEIDAGEAPPKEENYTYPLSQDAYAADLYDWPSVAAYFGLETPPLGNSQLLQYASTELQPVHSPTTGIVVDISPFTTADCTGNVVTAPDSDANAALTAILAAVNPLAGAAVGLVQYADLMAWQAAGDFDFCYVYNIDWNSRDLLNELGVIRYYVPIAGDMVTIQSSITGDLITYLVMDSEYFIDVGSAVYAGCVLGATLPLWLARWFPTPTEFTGIGYGAIWATDSAEETELNILSRYTTYPTGDPPCNTPTFGDCINDNPRFSYLGMASWGWVFDGESTTINPEGEISGLLLSETGITSAVQAVMLDPGLAYSIKVVAHVQVPNDGFTDSTIYVTLGTLTHTLAIPDSGEQTEIITASQTYTADIGDTFYTLGVELGEDEDGAEVVIDFLCLSDNEDPVLPRPNCLFVNPGFDQDTDWSLSGGATIGNGELLLPTSASQVITLAADTYALEVEARGSGGPVANTITISASGSTINIGGVPGALGVWRAQSFTAIASDPVVEIRVTHLATVGSPTGTATIEITADNAGVPGTALWTGTYTPTSNSVNSISVSSGPSLSAGSVYWVRLHSTNTQTSGNYWVINASTASVYAGGQEAYSLDSGTSWTTEAKDASIAIDTLSSGIPALDWELAPNGGGTALADGSYSISTNWDTYTSDPFTLSSAADGATFELSAANDTEVNYVCLIPTNQPTTPGKIDGEAQRDCNSCPVRYTGDVAHDLAEGIAWHDCRFRQVYFCDMREILVDIRTNTEEAVRGIGMLGRYAGALVSVQMKYMNGMGYYLAGYLNNTALAIQDSIAWQRGYSTVVTSDGNLGFWDVLGLLISGLRDVLVTTLDRLAIVITQLFTFLTPIVGTLLSVLESAVNILSNLIQTLLDQLATLQYLIAAIVTGANNATPEAIPGAPNCTASPEGLCWGIYLLDNTIFSGPVKDLLPILAGALTLNLLVWTLGRFRHVFENLG